MNNILLVNSQAFGDDILWTGQTWSIYDKRYRIRDFAGMWNAGKFTLVVVEEESGPNPPKIVDTVFVFRSVADTDFDKLFSCQQDAINYWVSINGWSLKIVRRCGENFYRIPYTYDDLPNEWEFTLDDFMFASRIASKEIAKVLTEILDDSEDVDSMV